MVRYERGERSALYYVAHPDAEAIEAARRGNLDDPADNATHPFRSSDRERAAKVGGIFVGERVHAIEEAKSAEIRKA